MMKSDVLDTFETIKACVAYEYNGQRLDHFPFDIEHGITPVYEELRGWQTDMTQFTNEEQFPEAFKETLTSWKTTANTYQNYFYRPR